MSVWSKKDLKTIWDNYQENIFWFLYPNHDLDLSQESFCYLCDELILKCQYIGWQKNGNCQWNVDHADANPKNNERNNLFVSHPGCNSWKGNRSFRELSWSYSDLSRKFSILSRKGIL